MKDFAIKDFELGSTVNVKAEGVAEAMYDYLPWSELDITVMFSVKYGWTVIDNQTEFKYEVSQI